jgi:hypothetical protein
VLAPSSLAVGMRVASFIVVSGKYPTALLRQEPFRTVQRNARQGHLALLGEKRSAGNHKAG